MYTLTLSYNERAAMDWVGNRYRHGDELSRLLYPLVPDGSDWEAKEDIVFRIPEPVAWVMCDIINGDEGLACFSGGFCSKLREFAGKVV